MIYVRLVIVNQFVFDLNKSVSFFAERPKMKFNKTVSQTPPARFFFFSACVSETKCGGAHMSHARTHTRLGSSS